MGRTIPTAVFETIGRHGDEVAVVDGEESVTFRELGGRIVEATRAMMAAGVGPGDRVAVWAPNSLVWVVAALGAQCAGAALVPVNTRWKGSEAAHLLSTARVSLLCTTRGFLGTDPVAMLDDDPTPLPGLASIVLLDGSGPPTGRPAGAAPVTSWTGLLSAGAAVTAGDAVRCLEGVSPHSPSDILFTSGTTGRPKGVVMHHDQTVRQFDEWCDFAGLEPGDRYLIVNPFFHMFGYKAGWLACLLRGLTLYPLATFDVDAALDIIERERITVLPGPPTIYRSLLDHPERPAHDLSTLRVAVTGAADVPVSLIEEIRAELPFSRLLVGYGLTEAGTCTGSSPDDDAETLATTAGRALPGMEVVIADGDGAEVARGVTGELLVRGHGVMQGYFDDAAATAETIDERGFLHTGDLATMDDRGYVRIVGRLKDMLIVGGFNVYPAEVENILLDHPDIGQVAVIGVPDQRLGEVAMAFVVPAPGRDPDPDALVAWSRDRMANYKAPRHVAVIDALPVNATGKVVKQDLRDAAASATAEGAEA